MARQIGIGAAPTEMHVSSDSLTYKNRSEPVDCKKSTQALYLLGKIQSGKSKEKL